MSRVAQLSREERALLYEKLVQKKAAAAARPAPPPLSEETVVREAPVSFSQERIWLIEQLTPGTSTYNIPGVLGLHGRLDVRVLAGAVGEIVRRHAALRTVFAVVEGRPVQRIEPHRPFPLPLVDLAGLPAERRETETRRLAVEEAARPFDLVAGPLFRAVLLRRAADEHLALYTMHHIVSDGWSMGVFFREAATLYAACAEGLPSPLPELPLQYAGFAVRQRAELAGEALAESLDWWRGALSGVAVLELPADHPRAPVRRGRGATTRAVFPPGLAEALAAVGRDGRATLYIVLLAAFQAFLHRLCGQGDVAVGSPVANRLDHDTEALIGCFVNTLVMRTDCGGDPPFRELLARAREAAVGAFNHQQVPFEQIVEAIQPERTLAHTPLFQVLFGLQNTPLGAVGLPGLVLEPVAAPVTTAKFDLTLMLAEAPDGLDAEMEYDLDLFEPATAARLVGSLGVLLEAAAAAPDLRLSELPLLTEGQRWQLLAEWNDSVADRREDLCLHQLFARQAARTPDAVAVSGLDAEWTYRELEERAAGFARRLLRSGVRPGERVAIQMQPSPERVAAVLAVLAAGAAYVPVEPALPAERRELLLREAGVRLVLDVLDGGLPAEPPDGRGFAGLPPVPPDAWAYVIYTSGSTGTPKGVVIEHRQAANTLLDVNRRFALGEGDRVFAVSALSFDLSVWDLFGTLAAGGTVVLPAPAEHPDPASWSERMARTGVTVWNSAPPLLDLFLQSGAPLPPALGLALLSGDWIPVGLPARIREQAPGCRVVSLGGATEGSIWSILFPVGEVDPAWRSIPYGRPMENQRFHVLERSGVPAAPGAVGELCIGGAGVAVGYLGRPELTAERFVPDPFSNRSGRGGARLYHTGDLGRYRADGTLEILGRLDDQVKIRGVRIEPGEIEAVLARHPEVREAAVLVRPGERELVVYVAVDGEPDLRRWLAERLPEAMVPAAFVVLPKLPLTHNGKVDRRELVKIAPERRSEEQVPPRTPLEQTLAELWVEVLGPERTGGRVGIYDNFFELGGHSLAAMRLVSRLRDVVGAELPLRALFEAPTVAALAAHCLIPAAPEEPVELAMDDAAGAPLSFAQERLWILDRIAPGTAAYNIVGGIRLHGVLDVPALIRSVQEIVRRHGSLRTRFTEEEGVPVQRVDPFDPIRPAPVPWIDLSGLPEEVRAGEEGRLTAEEAARPFDLAAGPLFRGALLRLATDEQVALYSMHHIVSDGWSMGVFFAEVAALYEAFAAGRPSPLPELPLQYAGHARRQRARLEGGEMESGLAEWRRILDGVASLDLPADRPRPAVRSWRGAAVRFDLDAAAAAGLAELARREKATLFVVLLGLFQAFLHRLSGQEDVVVGSVVANRADPDVAPLIGFFVNSVVMRTDLSGDPPVRELLGRARRTAIEAFRLLEIPFERVVEALQPERHTARAPLFQVMLALQNVPWQTVSLPGLVLEPIPVPMETAKFDLSLGVAEVSHGLTGELEHDLDLFDRSTAARLVDHLATFLGEAVAAPERRVSELPLLTGAGRRQILGLGARRSAAAVRRALPVLFEEQVDRTPEAPAVSLGGEHLTYRDLDARANRLAHWLVDAGVLPGDRVALRLERSPELVVAVLAVLKTGAAYLPLDPAWPHERIAFALEDSGAALVVDAAFLERENDAIARQSSERLEWKPDPELPAYVIYTSGSTGRPKGVVIPHGNVSRLFAATEPWFGFGPDDVWTLFHSYAFDFSVWEIWGALLHGGRLAVVPHQVSRDPEAFARLLREEEVTVLNQTPSAFRQLEPSPPAPLPQAGEGRGFEANPHPSPTRGRGAGGEVLRLIIFGGEALDPALLDPWFAVHGDERPRLVNMYGITETTVHVTFRPLTPEDAARPASRIGEPIPDLSVHVLDRHLEVQPLGVPGEICVGGEGLAQAYLGRPELTAERFVPDPFGERPGERLYRSGDLARRLPDGDLEYLGRIDQQVKIRGFRIELGEIESALMAHPDVHEAAVLALPDEDGKRLVAYVGGVGDPSELRRWLAGRLPEPMIPSGFVVLPRLPLTPNGKVGRRELAKIAPERRVETHVPPRTALEQALAGLWIEVLGTERTGGRVGVHDNFFELGGHSLAATRLVSRIRSVLGAELPLRALFEAPTVAALAAHCLAPAVAAAEPPLAPVPRDPAGMPLSFSQERLWVLDRLTPGTAVYNLPGPLRLRGPLVPELLARCFEEVRRRHEVLRTRFAEHAGAPVQVIDPPAPFVLPLVDLAALPGTLRGREAERLAGEEAAWPFDLERGPLLRAILLRLDGQDHGLLLTLHHVVTDGWSMTILFREIAALYEAFAAGRPSPLPELPLQVADVALWQRERLRGPALDSQVAWWRERLAGAPAALDLPLDRARPAVQTFRGDGVPLLLPPDLAGRLRSLARREGASLFMVLLAGLDLLLGRWSGQDDVLVGTPVAGRDRPELEELIGLFLNTLVLRVDLSGGPNLRTLLGRAREAALGAYAHQDVPFEKLLEDLQPERDLSRTPLFQVFLNLLNFPVESARLPGGLVLEPLAGTEAESKFDLTLYVSELGDGVSIGLVYNADLFDRARMEELARQLRNLLAQLAEAPDAPIDAVSLLTPEAVAVLPDPAAPLGEDWYGAVHALFAEQARRVPERIAVAGREEPGEGWTYGELADAAGRLAARLRADGVAPQEPVAIWAERGAPLVWAVMGVLWAGGAFVILDPAYPPARLAETIRLAAPRYWIEIAAAGAPAAEVQEALAGLAETGVLRGRLTLPVPLASLPEPVPPAAVGPDDLAYIAFTSGSTGMPKGILGRHGPLSHFLPFQRERFGLGEDDRVSLLSGLSHDPLQRDVFTPLCLGGTVCAPPAGEIAPGRLVAWMARQRITLAHLTPAMAQLLTEGLSGSGDGAAPAIPTLRWVLLVGDVLTRLDVDRLRRIAPAAICVNLYGSTETQRAVGFHVVEEREIADARAPQVLPLGRGMRDVQLLVMSRVAPDSPPRLAGVGEVGEIWVRSPHLARGYLADEALTAERFLEGQGVRSYRTGDLGRYRPDGEVTFAGRADQQVKIRGFRIELGEIEAALGRLPGVREAVVLAREGPGGPGDRALAAYVVGESGPPPPAAELRAELSRRLPAYMVPSWLIPLERLPVTPNGKVDRRALLRIDLEKEAGGDAGHVEPRSDLERRIAAIWRDVLGRERIGVRDNFFDLGGHSLLLVRLHARLQEDLGRELPLVDLFRHPNVEALAARLAGAPAEPATEDVAELETVVKDRAGRQIEAARRQRELARGRRGAARSE